MFVFGFVIAGGFSSRTLSIIFTVVQSKWASILSNMYTNCNARNTWMHCSRCHKYIHNNSLNGHENHSYGQKVSRLFYSSIQIIIFESYFQSLIHSIKINNEIVMSLLMTFTVYYNLISHSYSHSFDQNIFKY